MVSLEAAPACEKTVKTKRASAVLLPNTLFTCETDKETAKVERKANINFPKKLVSQSKLQLSLHKTSMCELGKEGVAILIICVGT